MRRWWRRPGAAYEGRLLFPWGYGVALTGITRRQFDETDLGEVLLACHVTLPQIKFGDRAL